MTQAELTFRAEEGGASQNAKLRRIFLERPGVEIAMPELAAGIGAYAVHSRVADLRRKFGMRIEQRSERGRDGKTHSFYRYLPENDAQPGTDG